MGAFWLCVGVAILAFCFGVLGLHLHNILPEDHASNSRDMIGAIVGLVSLLLALVLGTSGRLVLRLLFHPEVRNRDPGVAASIELDLALAGLRAGTRPPARP